MNKNRLKKICIISFVMAAVMCLAVFKNNVFENFRSIDEQTGSSTIKSEDQVMYVVTLKYMYQNGTLADSKDVYCYAPDDTIDLTIQQFDGYTSSINNINETIDDGFLDRVEDLDYVEVAKQENYNIYKIYYTITYVPAPSEYKVVHYLQNTDETYTKTYEQTISDDVYIGDQVSTKIVDYEGYTYNAEKSTSEAFVAKDGSTELGLYYDVNQKHIYLDSNGGTYFDPVIKKYKESIDLSSYIPVRDGYTFGGWECIDRTTDTVISTPSTMPNNDLYFRAKWIKSDASFNITYFLENANNDAYTNIGQYTVTNIESETNISTITNLQTLIANGFATIRSDTDYFEYNDTLSSPNFDVTVSGDSTTNINVYYDRKEYTLKFMAGRKNGSRYQISTSTQGSESASTWTTVSSAATITKNGVTYSNDEYTITAKYEADISDLWPTGSDVANTTYGYTTYRFLTWGTTSGSGYWNNHSNKNILGVYPTMSQDLIIDANDTTNVHTLYGYWQTSPKYFKYHYMYEALDQSTDTGVTYTNTSTGKTKYYVENSTAIVRTSNTASGQNGPEFYGYTLLGKTYTSNTGSSSESSPVDIYFYYDRNDLKLTIYNVNGEYVPDEMDTELNKQGIYLTNSGISVKYGADISSVETLYKQWQADLGNTFKYPISTSETKERDFNKWYLDQSCSVEMDWTNTAETVMTSNLTLYANWIEPVFSVTYNVDGGTWNDTSSAYTYEDGVYKLEVNSGKTLVSPTAPTRDGYTFSGWWYTDENGDELEYLFSESQKVYSDIELTAKWEAKEEGTYRVRYAKAQYDANGKVITDVSQYSNIEYLADEKVVTGIKYGSLVKEDAIFIKKDGVNMYVVDGYTKTITLSTNEEDNIIYFLYSPEQSITYTVYYLLDNGTRYEDGQIPPESEYLADKKEVTKYSLDDLVVTESSIEIDGYEVDAYKKSTYLVADTEDLSSTRNAIYFYYSPVERKGNYEVNYYFMDEDGTYPTTPDYTASGKDSVGKYIRSSDYATYLPLTNPLYEGHEYDSDKSDVLMVVISSGETATLNLYFKNKTYTVEYDTVGGDFTDTSDIYTQKTQEIYTTNVTYKDTAPEPTAPTKENNRFLGWYDEATDTLYDFDTQITDDVKLYAKWMEQKDITVKKVWDDNKDQDGKRPDSVTVNVKAGDTSIKQVTITADDGWTKTIEDLDVYDTQGNEIEYSVEEVAVTDYTTEYSTQDNTYTITNKHTPETKTITLNKVWDDSNNQDGKRPDTLDINLKINDEIYDTITLDKNSNWVSSIEVPVYKGGSVATYTVEETYVEGYTSSVEYNGNNITVTNTHTPETKTITLNKVWDDSNNQDGKRPDSVTINIKNGTSVVKTVTLQGSTWTATVDNLPVYANGVKIEYSVEEVAVTDYTTSYEIDGNNYTVTNTHTPETRNITVTKTWNDGNNQDGLRPETVNIVLKADNTTVEEIELSSANSWTKTVEDLPVYKNGTAINYTIDEEQNANYTTTVETTTEGFNVINTHEVEKTSLNVSKTWVDNKNQDGLRPTSLNVNLLANGVVVDTQTLNDVNGWAYSWNSIDKNSAGSEITYTVEEASVTGYTLSKTYNATTNTWELTNTHTPQTKTITVNKVWDDNNDQDGKRPDSLKITLNKNGAEYKSVTLNEENSWTASFEDLDVYENQGTTINYTVEEENVTDYTSSVLVTGNTYTYTNTHEPEKTDKTVTKVWRDGSNKDNTRPNSIKFRLLKNGEYLSDIITLTADNSNGNTDEWEYTFSDLPVYENGEKIEYTVEETEVPKGYGVIYNQNTLKIYNAYPPELEVSVEKIWDDENNADGIRPESITVQLYADGKPYTVDGQNVGLVTLSAENNWKYTWEFVEKYNSEGEKYTYTLGEVDVGNDKYASNVALKDDLNPEFQSTYSVTNSYVPQKTDKTVTKVWDDNNNQDGKRPDSVTVRLLANGTEVANATLSDTNNWTYTFENVNVNQEGIPIEYTVTEDAVTDYTTNVTYDNNGTFTVTNTHVPEKKTISINKVWDDNNNQDGKRPDSVEVTLKADGATVTTFDIASSDTWKKSVENLDVYKNGTEITYTIEETEVADYTTNISSNGNEYTITNTHTPEKMDITFEKTWDDDNNRDGIRPANINLTLKNGDEVVKSNIILNKSSNWSATVTGLDKYKDGQKINYTVDEVSITGYTSEYNYDELDNGKVTVTNTHTPEKKTINISKTWQDDEDLYQKRPDSILVDLYANDTLLQTVTLESSSSWETAVGGLYTNENGKEIVYTVKEHENESYTTTTSTKENTITLTNTIITYDIVTKVNGIGGTISGQGLDYYERVAYKDSTTKDIVITPNEGYQISKITINDVEQELPQDTKSEYTLDKFDTVTEDKTVVVEFKKIEYQITTEVVGGNGTISGEGNTPYETVKHGENSKESIVLTPNTGYEIAKITVNGVEQELPEDVTVPYTLDLFTNVKENKHVIVEYQKTAAKVIVSYETRNGKKLCEDVVKEGYLGDEYTSEALEFENYVLIETPDNKEGTMDTITTKVKYVYEYRPNIYITKTVRGNYADVERKFSFEVNIKDADDNAYTESIQYDVVDENNNIISQGEITQGNGNIEIAHNQKATIYGVPENLVYTVKETNATGYDTYINNTLSEEKEITGVLKANTTIDFVNEKEYVSPTGIILNVLPFAVGIALVIIVILLIKKKKKRHDDE